MGYIVRTIPQYVEIDDVYATSSEFLFNDARDASSFVYNVLKYGNHLRVTIEQEDKANERFEANRRYREEGSDR